MDLDNPSYFAIVGDNQMANLRISNGSVSSASDCSLSRQSTPPRNKNRYRTFSRSLSSNSNDSNRLLINGEPRLSDLAPDLAAKHIALQKNLKNNIPIREDLIYSALPSSDETLDNLSGDEVFIAEDCARYYNITAGKSNSRRHSIGTFVVATEISNNVSSFKDDFPQGLQTTERVDSIETPATVIDEHALRHSSYPRKRCNRCVRGFTPKTAGMGDILMVSLKCSAAASLWVDYFSSYFQQIGKQTSQKPFKVHHLSVEELNQTQVDTSAIIEKSTFVKLQLVVVCPGFLEYVSENPDGMNFGKLFLPDRTLALLLGVNDNDLTDVHRKALPTYYKWQRLSVGQDQDENFTKEFISQAMAIVSRVWKQQSSLAAQEKSCFSVSPKKIRQGQNSVFILLTHPLQKEDILKILIEKHNEIYEIKNVKRRNPYTIKISVPDKFTEVTTIINILVEKNGSIIGRRPIKCESKLMQLEQILRSSNHPVEFMCQTLGFSPADREHLDNWLVNNFQKNLPPHFNLLANHSTPFAAAVSAHKHSYEEYPTLLHFAAKFGLEKLAMQLIDCPGADLAYEVKNIYDLTPPEIAESNDHGELATALRNYINMNDFSNMYHKLKAISMDTSNINDIDYQEYLTPRDVANLYNVCPPPRPLTLKLSPPPSPVSSPSTSLTPSGYTAMHSPISSKDLSKPEEKFSPPSPSLSTEIFKQKKTSSDVPSMNRQHLVDEDKVQKELLEIMNDFKNNVHSISQVEKLVEEWKNRNDVQKSFKEKQEQLKEMRSRYEKIQHEMKLALKKPSPFDRIRKVFSRSKSREEPPDISRPMVGSTNTLQSLPVQRPISSLSTSSSGSSGRMSTISGSSLGDSGTHSDNEERKNLMRMHNDDDFRNELNKVMEMHYNPLPAPKPVKTGIMSHRLKLSTTIEEIPSSLSRTEAGQDQYYIQFPPSGLPVPNVANLISAHNQYINVNATMNEDKLASEDSRDSHDYMNLRPPNNTN